MVIRTIQNVNLEDLEDRFIRQTSTGESIYQCPWCPENNPDTRGHLYINRVKGVGECKKCLATVKLKETKTLLQQRIEEMHKKQSEGGDDDEMDGITLREMFKTTEAMGFKQVTKNFESKYLDDRNIPPEIAVEALVLHNPSTGELLFPFLNPYNLQNISGWAIRRPSDTSNWTNTKSARKNIYLPAPAVAYSTYIVLVEGVADALSLFARGYPGVGIGGVNLTSRQVRQLFTRRPSSIDILLDKDATGEALSLASYLSSSARNAGLELVCSVRECPKKDPALLTWNELAAVMGSELTPAPDQAHGFPKTTIDFERQKPGPRVNGVDPDRGDYL